jgi:hypothetical protein
LISKTQQDKQPYFLVNHGKFILIYLNFSFYQGLRQESNESNAYIVNSLIQFGADINHQDNNKETPLIFGILKFSKNFFN